MEDRLRVGVITAPHGIKGEFEQSKKMMKQMSGMMGGKKRHGGILHLRVHICP